MGHLDRPLAAGLLYLHASAATGELIGKVELRGRHKLDTQIFRGKAACMQSAHERVKSSTMKILRMLIGAAEGAAGKRAV